MVTIVGYKNYQREGGEVFYALEVQGGIESVKSKDTGRTYFTARTTNVPCTFNEPTCKALVGTQMPGAIKKVTVDPYEFTIRETGEIIKMSHRYEYLSEEESIVESNVLKNEMVY
ncbi:hypothetical protein [Flavobacterium sp. LS1R10]|uniref:hypothetical protein n=1 Tax=Flavobacterium sp. LS1R10 TaxID=2497482 RepID=UPI001F242B2D|nr:hypothetical protein [Flavobacterium sp. LS1R10]